MLVAGLGVAFSLRAIESAMCFFAMVLGLGGVAAVLGSPLVALLLILTYAGAIVVLFVFVAMAVGTKTTVQRIGITRAICAGALFAALVVGSVWPLAGGFAGSAAGTGLASGRELLADCFLPTQLVGWLLLWVCVGAINLVRSEKPQEERK